MGRDEEMRESKEMYELRKTVEELRSVREKLRSSEEMYRFLAENSVDAIWRLDDQLRFIYVSPAVWNIIGYRPEEMTGRHLFTILSPESVQAVIRGLESRRGLQDTGQRWGSSTYTVEAVHRDGHRIWAEVSVNPIFGDDNRLTGFNGITRDISERRRNEEVIRQYAFRDPLTDLPNRRSFEEVLGNLVQQRREMDNPFAVLFLDVDGLKRVNDAYGHAAGDALLQAVADRLRLVMRKEDYIARLAGDEFMAILPGVGDSCAADYIATRLLDSFGELVDIGGRRVKTGVSIGISFFPAHAKSVNLLMSYADQAMYRAKKNGGSSYACYG